MVLGSAAEIANSFRRLSATERFNTGVAIGLLLVSSLVTINLLVSNSALTGAAMDSLASMANRIERDGYTLTDDPSLRWPPGYGLLGLPVYI